MKKGWYRMEELNKHQYIVLTHYGMEEEHERPITTTKQPSLLQGWWQIEFFEPSKWVEKTNYETSKHPSWLLCCCILSPLFKKGKIVKIENMQKTFTVVIDMVKNHNIWEQMNSLRLYLLKCRWEKRENTLLENTGRHGPKFTYIN